MFLANRPGGRVTITRKRVRPSALCVTPGRARRTTAPTAVVTGREVCSDYANALFMGSAAGTITGNVGSGFGVWAMLMRKFRRSG